MILIMTQIKLYNSLTRTKDALTKDAHNNALPIGMYVCGPTVYSRPHIGNARSCVIYDVLFRLLRHVYGDDGVNYVRNITDVDDKINKAAIERGISIQQLTTEITEQFHHDIDAVGCLRPNIEPKATEHIAEIIAMIERLLKGGYAYISHSHVLFDITAKGHDGWNYGMLSGRQTEEQEAGARVAVEAYKRNSGDFVLWKPSDAQDDISSVFASPWGQGRPGWHIECSAMSTRYLGADFAIHGGGADLKFPHHENEIAQSCCANIGSHYAHHWVHNGFLTVDGEKMSKSLGNFITVHDLLERGVRGEVIRFALLSSHYAKPLDWNDKLLEDCTKQLDKFYRMMKDCQEQNIAQENEVSPEITAPEITAPEIIKVLSDDLNLPKAIAVLHSLPAHQLKAAGAMLGLLQQNPNEWFAVEKKHTLDEIEIAELIAKRAAAKIAKNWAEADNIRNSLLTQNITLKDNPDGTTSWS